MKNTLLIITVILFTSKVLAQDFVIPKKTIEEIKKNGLLVNTGQVAPEVDEVFKKSINLYWRASSIKFVQYDERQINKEKEPLYFISNFKGIGVALNGKHEYTFTDFRLKNVGYGSYDCPYDNLVAKSIDYGVVKNNDHIKRDRKSVV